MPGSLPALFDLTGKTALVSGCSRGLGRAMAAALAEAGADIIGVSSSISGNAGVEAEVQAYGRAFVSHACDFADRGAVYAFVDTVRRDAYPVDVLINNAGTIERAAAVDHPDVQWDRVLEVDLSAQFVLTRELGRDMIARGTGKVVFVASLLSFQGGINVPGYAAAKGGIGQLTKAFANEWASQGVNVNAIAPGYMRTDNTRALQADEVRSRQILQRIPAARWGEPEDIKGAVVFLSSAASDYVHGEILTVDGGWMGR